LIVTDPLTLADTSFTTATVETQAQGAGDAQALVDQLLSDGKINAGNANALSAKLNAAIASFDGGQVNAGVNQLQALLNQLDALVRSGKLSAADVADLRALINRIIASAA
jgi:polyhydroxyalkanoate synthesis regulator phasin